MRPVLVRDLALEHWPSMDRYADALATRIDGAVVPTAWRMHGPRYLTRYWTYPRALRASRGDLVHVLDHSYAHCLRAFRGMPSVVTVHDLLPLRILAEDGRSVRRLVRDRLVRWSLDWLARADRFIVSTRWTAGEMARYFDSDPASVHVVPYGVDAHFFQRPADETVTHRRHSWLEHLGMAEPVTIILHVGSCAPRKNVDAAIAALGRLRAGGVNAILVQIGGTFEAPHAAALSAAKVEPWVLQEPSVPEAALVSAYAAADVLVMPSTFEGFGLPAIEAMAAGLPVVTSGAGGLREAVADAAMVTGSTSADSLADAVGTLLSDAARRTDLVARGRRRAADLTWDACAARTTEVHAALLSSRSP